MSELTRQEIEVMLSVAYRASWRDGSDGKDLPTIGELDQMVAGIYDRATEDMDNSDKVSGWMPETDKDMTSSHNEADIYKGCISLMDTLTGNFYEWLDFIGVDVVKLDAEEQFVARFYPTEIVERLFLWRTKHSGGTSQRMKCKELGIDADKMVTFDFSEELAEGAE